MQKTEDNHVYVHEQDLLEIILKYDFKVDDEIVCAIYEPFGLDKKPIFKETYDIEKDCQEYKITVLPEKLPFDNHTNDNVDFWYEVILNNEKALIGANSKGPAIITVYPGGYYGEDHKHIYGEYEVLDYPHSPWTCQESGCFCQKCKEIKLSDNKPYAVIKAKEYHQFEHLWIEVSDENDTIKRFQCAKCGMLKLYEDYEHWTHAEDGHFHLFPYGQHTNYEIIRDGDGNLRLPHIMTQKCEVDGCDYKITYAECPKEIRVEFEPNNETTHSKIEYESLVLNEHRYNREIKRETEDCVFTELEIEGSTSIIHYCEKCGNSYETEIETGTEPDINSENETEAGNTVEIEGETE